MPITWLGIRVRVSVRVRVRVGVRLWVRLGLRLRVGVTRSTSSLSLSAAFGPKRSATHLGRARARVPGSHPGDVGER